MHNAAARLAIGSAEIVERGTLPITAIVNAKLRYNAVHTLDTYYPTLQSINQCKT